MLYRNSGSYQYIGLRELQCNLESYRDLYHQGIQVGNGFSHDDRNIRGSNCIEHAYGKLRIVYLYLHKRSVLSEHLSCV